MSGTQTVFEVKNMFKNFGVTVALNDVSFSLKSGEVRGLIGENGSGKSTVSSIIAGIQPATKGEMFFHGEPWKPVDTLYAQQHGIGMIVQEAGTIANLTVAENIFLGHEKMFSAKVKASGKELILPIISRKKMNDAANEILRELGITKFSADRRVSSLNMQDRKIVEIVKCLYWKPEILIVDETTTALSHEGREFLYASMKRLKEAGKSVLMISHDLDEMEEYCDELTVLRDGVIIGTVEKKDYDQNVIRRMMVGREVKGDYYRNDFEPYEDDVVLKAEKITTMKDLLCFDLELHRGEILGIGGLSDCGMRTVGRALFGLEKILDGRVYLPESGETVNCPHKAVDMRMGYISKNRDNESLGLGATIYENIASTGYDLNKKWKFFVSHRKEEKYVDKQVTDLLIKCASVNHKVSTLSGGNKQKVAFGKWMACDAQIIVMDCPTRGVDVGVKAAMYDIIHQMKKAGKSVILISEELQELIGMSDRILIMKDGRVTHEAMRAPGLSEHQLIDYMI